MSELIDINKVITCLDFAIDAINHECYNDALSSINEAKEAYNTRSEWIPVSEEFDKWDEWLFFWDGHGLDYDAVSCMDHLIDQNYTHYFVPPSPPKVE